MNRRLLILASGAALASAALNAQTHTVEPSNFQQNGWVHLYDWTSVPSHINRPEGQAGPVLGKPFSGTEVRQTAQVLSDGTNVKQSDTSTFYRDSQGRMRSESASQALIYDPIAGLTYTLDPGHKYYSKNRIHADSTVSIATVGNRTSVNSTTTTSTTTDSLGHKLHFTPIPRHSAPPSSSEDLPAQVVNGILARGSRYTVTIPAGAFGNDRDVKVVSERWFSDDLQVLVKSSYADPRFGTTTYELTNIVQASPDAALFQVPADYTANPNH